MLELLPMVPTGGQYQPRTFWAQLLELDAGTVVNIEAPETDAGDGGGGKIQRGQLSVSFLLQCPHMPRTAKNRHFPLNSSFQIAHPLRRDKLRFVMSVQPCVMWCRSRLIGMGGGQPFQDVQEEDASDDQLDAWRLQHRRATI